jgi:hypothetical protein
LYKLSSMVTYSTFGTSMVVGYGAEFNPNNKPSITIDLNGSYAKSSFTMLVFLQSINQFY